MTGSTRGAERQPLPAAPPPIRLPRLRRSWLWALIIIGAVTLVAFNVGRQAFTGWSIDQQAAELEARLAAAEAENLALQRQLEYLQSDAYVTLEARRLRNLGYPGEQVLMLPPLADSLGASAAAEAAVDDRPMVERWLDLFLGSPAPE